MGYGLFFLACANLTSLSSTSKYKKFRITMFKRIVLLLSLVVCVVGGIVHFTYDPVEFFWPFSISKTVICVLYSLVALLYREKLVALALFVGAAGDFILAMANGFPERHMEFFTIGALVFLLSHVVYLVYSIYLHRGLSLIYLLPYLVGGAAFIVATEVVFDTETNIVIPTYVLFLVTMGWRTGSIPKRGLPDWIIAFAGILFIVSDTTLGVRVFLRSDLPYGRAITMFTYWAAQSLFLIQSAMRSRAAAKGDAKKSE